MLASLANFIVNFSSLVAYDFVVSDFMNFKDYRFCYSNLDLDNLNHLLFNYLMMLDMDPYFYLILRLLALCYCEQHPIVEWPYYILDLGHDKNKIK